MSTETRNDLVVPIEKLRFVCDPSKVQVGTYDAGLGAIGQERAMASIDLGMDMSVGPYAIAHYNVVVVGSANTGRTAKTLEHVHNHVATVQYAPPDVLCLQDPSNPLRRLIAIVPNGSGQAFKKELAEFGLFVTTKLSQLVARRREFMQDFLNKGIAEMVEAVEAQTKPLGFGVVNADESRLHLMIIPLSRLDPSQKMSESEYAALSQEERQGLQSGPNFEAAKRVLTEAVDKQNDLIGSFMKQSEQMEPAFIRRVIAEPIAAMVEQSGGHAVIAKFLMELEKLVTLSGRSEDGNDGLAIIKRLTTVDILVDNAGVEHPPVVHVTVPQFSELFGRISAHVSGSESGFKIDNLTVEAPAFLKANGGYLILDLGDLLRWGGGIAFYKLLQVIRTRKLAIESKAKFADAEALVDIRTDEVPIDVRVIAICDHQMAHMLRQHEKEFENLFRITAEFEDKMNVDQAMTAYASFVELCRVQDSLPDFSPEAVAKLVEYGIRRAGRQDKASTEFGILKDVVTEAAHWASTSGSGLVGPEHVRKAVDERFNRQALSVRSHEDYLDRGIWLIDLDGHKVGHVNALVVYTYSTEIRFGSPKRVTARAFAGKGGLVLVQKEAELSGPLTDASIAVIRGYLSGQYGRKKPLSLSVQLCFEQCYGGIDGDSASLAETIATISAITELPVDQRLSITGSMNQWGEVQVIGGVNEKIEGHFDLLRRAKVLKPGCGVVIPHKNIGDLMLKEEVVEAHRRGDYQIHAVQTIDQALELLLGRPAAEIHDLVESKLDEMRGKKAAPSS